MNNMNDNRSKAGLVERYIGTAYDVVKEVADAIAAGWLTSNNMQAVDTAYDLLSPILGGQILDRTKPYFTRGNEQINDGGGAYYVYSPKMEKALADGKLYIDPDSPLDNQGHMPGFGIWRAQTTISMEEGPQGAQGVPGETGSDGLPGEDGINGASGVPGADGHDGNDGHDGTDGSDGADGLHGSNGTHGTDGAKGVDGADGGEGPAGPPGSAGANGTDGTSFTIAGSATIAVIEAKAGVAGAMWITTDAGNMKDGTVVEIGDGIVSGGPGSPWIHAGPIRGPQGNTGGPGVAGPRGEPGDTGSTGPEGPLGQGIHLMGKVDTVVDLQAISNPENGDIYYVAENEHLWVYDNGRPRLLSSLGDWHDVGLVRGPAGQDGDKGTKGDRGLTGPKGNKGDRGAPGATGVKGATGARGATGPSGPRGVQGAKGDGNFHKGTGNPANSLGVNGDIYVKYV